MNEDKIKDALLYLWNHKRNCPPDVPVKKALQRIKQAVEYPNRIYPEDVMPEMVKCYDKDGNEVHSVAWYDPTVPCYCQYWDEENECDGATSNLTQLVRSGPLRLVPKTS